MSSSLMRYVVIDVQEDAHEIIGVADSFDAAERLAEKYMGIFGMQWDEPKWRKYDFAGEAIRYARFTVHEDGHSDSIYVEEWRVSE